MVTVIDPKRVTVTFDNRYVTGFAADTMLTLEKDEEDNLPYNGVLGEHVVSKNASDVWTLTCSLAASSPWVTFFREYAQMYDMVKPLSITNMNMGQQDVSTGTAYVKQAPAYSVGKEIEEVEVEITVVNPTFA